MITVYDDIRVVNSNMTGATSGAENAYLVLSVLELSTSVYLLWYLQAFLTLQWWNPQPLKFTPPRYNWNIVESGVKHHNPLKIHNSWCLIKCINISPASISTCFNGCRTIIWFTLSTSHWCCPATGKWSILPHLWLPGKIYKSSRQIIENKYSRTSLSRTLVYGLVYGV